MTTRTFLAVVGGAYLVLAAWCALRPAQTASSVGFTLQAGSGESEYLVIYGGLQTALGLAFLWPLVRKSALQSVLLLCLTVHACLVAFRTLGFTLYSGIQPTTYILAGIEWLILLVAVWRFFVGK